MVDVEKVKNLVSEMTLEEKARLLSGDGWWMTHGIDRLGIPAIFMSDGPHGLRKTPSGEISASVPATCFPTASALASSWDTAMIGRVGVALGREAQANGVQILLGPGVNMKRSPLGGRNFEYYAEDPILAGKLASAFIDGLQGEGVGASLKHFAANNQEFERMAMSSNLDLRTLHEIYLPAFEIAVKEARPWSVMCAYNKVNGTYASEHPLLLQEILRDRWGFRGFVVSDWGAVNDREKGVRAGLNLEMPGSGDYNRKKIIEAVAAGRLPVASLDSAVIDLVSVVLVAKAKQRPAASFDADEHHALARLAAGECIVLLKNEGGILPIDATRTKRIALIGAFAKLPRYQGAGSSQVNPTRVANAYDELAGLVGAAALSYAEGYTDDGATTAALIEEAQRAARAADLAIVVAGLPDSYESEGFDRASLDMPEGHNRLIEAVADVQPNCVVVLMNGSAVTMPWAGRARAIVEGWLGGQAGGGAIADVLTGKVNPSGKLSETFPVRLEDTPTYPDFPGRGGEAYYGEGLFIGYRHYDTRKVAPLFPFGFGLSYTTFAYSNIRVDASALGSTGAITVEVTVKNTGNVAGKEVVQLYVHERRPAVVRPEKELKSFAKVALDPGQEATVSLRLTRRDFAHYDPRAEDWVVTPGVFELLAGGSSRDLPLKATVEIPRSEGQAPTLSRASMVKEFRDHPQGRALYPELLKVMRFDLDKAKRDEALAKTPEERMAVKKTVMSTLAFLDELPVNKLPAFSEGRFTESMLDEMLEKVRA